MKRERLVAKLIEERARRLWCEYRIYFDYSGAVGEVPEEWTAKARRDVEQLLHGRNPDG